MKVGDFLHIINSGKPIIGDTEKQKYELIKEFSKEKNITIITKDVGTAQMLRSKVDNKIYPHTACERVFAENHEIKDIMIDEVMSFELANLLNVLSCMRGGMNVYFADIKDNLVKEGLQ